MGQGMTIGAVALPQTPDGPVVVIFVNVLTLSQRNTHIIFWCGAS
jgi:hypothetical protein